nr:coat protein [Digitaria streak virus]
MSSSMKRKRTDEGSGSRRFTKKKSAAKGRTSSSRVFVPPSNSKFWFAGATTIVFPLASMSSTESYSRGSGEGDRHTNETVTYKAAFDYHFSANAGPCAYSSIGVGVLWLVYDAQPSGQVPAVTDIFPHDTTLQSFPYTWKVGREVCHRFVVKRRWCFTMETNGRIGSDKPPSNAVWPPCKRSIYFHKFATGLGVKTEWKNTTDGGVGSIKKGALYFVIAPGSGIDFTLFGTCRMYFKSVGNQ